MVAECEARLSEFGEEFWDGPDDFRAISLATRGE
jgi:hypothetical protein